MYLCHGNCCLSVSTVADLPLINNKYIFLANEVAIGTTALLIGIVNHYPPVIITS